MRILAGLFGFVLFASLSCAGDEGIAGNWKLVILEDGQPVNPWLLRIEHKGGKWTGEADGLKGVPASTVHDFKIAGDLIQFDLRVANRVTFQFEGKAPRAGAKKVLGSFTREGRSIAAYLEATAAKNSFELDRELLTRTPNDPRVFNTLLDLIAQAKDNKASAKDVQEWVDGVLRTSESYGPRFQGDYTLKLVEVLGGQKDYAAIAGAVAVKAEGMLDAKASALGQLRFLTTLGGALQKAGMKEKAQEIEARLEALEEGAFAEYSKPDPDFTPTKFKGRKAKSDRTVLVELFTGAMCPPCVASDLAFDALEKTYPSSDVVLLQYHLHIPGPDALTNADAEKRSEFYARSLRGTPSVYLNGKPIAAGGGGREDAEDAYQSYRKSIEPLLEKPAGAHISARAVRKGDKIAIAASVKDVEKPGESTRLRFALVEDWVRYKARNGMMYHHRVVRALPGGATGFAVKQKDVEQTVTIDLNDVRTGLGKYLDNYAQNESPFPDAQRPMRFRSLRVVAFVQQDETSEVLQAIETQVVVE